MRISDWSSDVCSSDLACNVLRPAFGNLPAIRYDHEPIRQRHDGPHDVFDDQEGDAALADFMKDRQDVIHLRRGQAGHDLIEQKKFRLRGERSEEHTSELQSLMRISYAVFCLKKKKTTKKIES